MESDEEFSGDSSFSENSDESDSEMDAVVSDMTKIAHKIIANKVVPEKLGNKIVVNDVAKSSDNKDNKDCKETVDFLSFDPLESKNVNNSKNKTNLNPKPMMKGQHRKRKTLASSLQPSGKTDTYINVNAYGDPKTKTFQCQKMNELNPKSKEAELLKKSVVTPDFEKKDSIKAYSESQRQLKLQRRKERDLTKGKNWFDMPAAEMTEEKKNDLNVLQMRRVLDPKRFYKNSDMKALPKFFQMGKVVESAADFYHARIPKKQRKANIVEELLADAEFRKFNKRKYVEIQEKTAKSRGRFKHAKRLKSKRR